MKKALAMILSLVLFCSALSGCGSGVRDDVAVADISAGVAAAIGKADEMTHVNEAYIKGFMQLDPGQFGQWSVMINAYGTSADEFGVFKAGELDVKGVRDAVDAYLRLRLDTWMDEYMPEEKPKLSSAEIKTNGNCVMYCILGDADKSAAFAAFDGALK